LKDDKNNIDSFVRQNANQHQQTQHHHQSLMAESQVQHFIKWIQQDGILAVQFFSY
jgi:hypothetical protein